MPPRTPWSDWKPLVVERLDREDDLDLWNAAVDLLYRDAEYLCLHNPQQKLVISKLGRCSHWLRPHSTRWTADGGFAWPSGYDGRRFSRFGLPEFDWQIVMVWDAQETRWLALDEHSPPKRRRTLEYRAVIPARTSRHAQAAIFTLWRPGTPPEPTSERRQLYGFRKKDDRWSCTATWGRAPYSIVANAVAEPPGAEASPKRRS